MTIRQGEVLRDIVLEDLEGQGVVLSSLPGDKKIIFMFASWHDSRSQLPLWEEAVRELPTGTTFAAVAMDVGGPTLVRPLASDSLPFPLLVDTENHLAATLGLRALPAILFIQAGNRFSGLITQTTGARDEKTQALIRSFSSGQTLSLAPPERRSVDAHVPIHVRLARHFVARGLRKKAAQELASALALDPENDLIQGQLWSLEHPDRFYPEIDLAWQEEQRQIQPVSY